MKQIRTALLLSLIVLLSTAVNGNADQHSAPSKIGGFTLKSDVSDYDIPHHKNYLNEVIITDLKGFRKGFIMFGTCENPGKILRIKLKYHDRSFKFFEQLLKRYKQSFGAKPKFSGDRFGNVKSWRWTFTDADGHRVSLVLQHNLKDTSESVGNMVKLSMPDLMDAERLCFNETHTSDSSQQKQTGQDWEILIPR